ncbi:MAG TPA: SRPBCC family protein [Burkholderiales bacterium]|nr:SRPBCC family protein [Burkholderiales bacterium]
MRRCVAFLVLSVLLGTPASGFGDAIDVEAHRDGEGVVLEASAWLHASVQQVWSVLTDYERYPQFVPDLTESRVIARNGKTITLEQRGQAGFIFFHYPIEVQLEVVEQPPERVTSHAISGNFKRMDGLYELRPEGDLVHLVYRGRLVPAFSLPPVVGLPAVRSATERQFAALVREIKRRVALASER